MFKKRPYKKSAVSYIVEQIEQAIIEQGLQPGDKLPPSRELQQLLGSSQGTLREALRILEQKGLIESRLGRSGGIYVKAVSSEQISESLGLLIRQKQVSQEHLFVFRCTLEVSAASLASVSPDKNDIQQLKKLQKKAGIHLKKGISAWEAFYEVENQLHQQLARMTHNPLFESVLLTVYNNYPNYNHDLIPSDIHNMKNTYNDWEQLIQAIEKKRPDTAGMVMTRHIHLFLPPGMILPS